MPRGFLWDLRIWDDRCPQNFEQVVPSKWQDLRTKNRAPTNHQPLTTNYQPLTTNRSNTPRTCRFVSSNVPSVRIT
jgi:hypothetical protein